MCRDHARTPAEILSIAYGFQRRGTAEELAERAKILRKHEN